MQKFGLFLVGSFLFLSTLLLLSFQKNSNLTPTLRFIRDNFKYDSKIKIHHLNTAIQDSIDYYSVDGKGFFQVFMGLDTTTIKQTLGEPDQNWLYTYRYFLDTCCNHPDNPACSFNCSCLMLRIAPNGKCNTVRLGRYFKGQ
jgi:hypothetical protein